MGFLDDFKKEWAAAGERVRQDAETYGRQIMSVNGEGGTSMTLYERGIEFRSPDTDLNPGKRVLGEVSSVSIEDGEALESRITVTRLLLTGPFALALKKKKGGTKFVTVEGEDFLWPMEVGRKQVGDAQKLVMKARSLMKSA